MVAAWTSIKGSVPVLFQLKFILFFGFNFQFRDPDFASLFLRLLQQLLAECFAAQTPALSDLFQFIAVKGSVLGFGYSTLSPIPQHPRQNADATKSCQCQELSLDRPIPACGFGPFNFRGNYFHATDTRFSPERRWSSAAGGLNWAHGRFISWQAHHVSGGEGGVRRQAGGVAAFNDFHRCLRGLLRVHQKPESCFWHQPGQLERTGLAVL